MDINAIILAAGAGTRMKSDKSKVIHEVCFKPLIKWVYSSAVSAGINKIVTVVGHKAEQVKECLGDNAFYAMQTEQLGTGHAVMCAMPQLNDDGCVIVLSGDVPLITEETLRNAIEYHNKNRLSATVITAIVDNPKGYGRIIRDEEGNVESIVEEKDATAAQKLVTEINSGLYCFDTGLLRAALSDIKTENAQGEYYLTDTIEILIKNGYNVGAYTLTNPEEIMGINDRVQLAEAQSIMQRRIISGHQRAGVTVINPSDTCIGGDVKIGKDTVIYPGCVLEGDVVIGANCCIGPNCHIKNSTVGDECKISNSVIFDSDIENNTCMGPFAYVCQGE